MRVAAASSNHATSAATRRPFAASCSLSPWERVGVRGLPGNHPSGYAKVSPGAEQLCGTSNANGPCRSFSFSLEGEGWDEGGCCLQQPRHIGSNPPPLRRLLLPLPVGAGWGEGSSGQPSLGLRKRLLWKRVGVRVFAAHESKSPVTCGPVSARQRRSRPFPSHFGHFPLSSCQPPGLDGSGQRSFTLPEPSQRVQVGPVGGRMRGNSTTAATTSAMKMIHTSSGIPASALRRPPSLAPPV